MTPLDFEKPFSVRKLEPEPAPLDGTCKNLSMTKFEVSSFTRSEAYGIGAIEWLDARRGCAQTNAWISVVFLSDPH